MLYFALLGSIGWLTGLADLLNLTRKNPDSMSPGEFIVYTALILGALTTGLGHLRWYRLLESELNQTQS